MYSIQTCFAQKTELNGVFLRSEHGHWLLIPQWHLLAGRSVGVTYFSLGAAHFCIFLLVVSTSLFRAGYFSALADS